MRGVPAKLPENGLTGRTPDKCLTRPKGVFGLNGSGILTVQCRCARHYCEGCSVTVITAEGTVFRVMWE